MVRRTEGRLVSSVNHLRRELVAAIMDRAVRK